MPTDPLPNRCRTAAAGERSKLQKMRDDLAAQLRIAQQRAKEAEEEQCRAEEEAAALRAELAALHMQQSHFSAGDETADTADSGALSVRLVSDQLESERVRTASLLGTLTATKAQLDAANAKLEMARMQAQAAQQQAAQQQQQEAGPGAAELGHYQQQVQELQQQAKQLAAQLDASQLDAASAQQHLAALKQQLLGMQQQHEEAQQQLSTALSDLQLARQELERRRRAQTTTASEGGASAYGPASYGPQLLPGSQRQSHANLAALGSEEELREECARLALKVGAAGGRQLHPQGASCACAPACAQGGCGWAGGDGGG
jgi:chromosome segregation ATPase